MSTREREVVTHLRGDATLVILAPGGIYADADLTEAGITDPTLTPDVWSNGALRNTIVVRQRADVPDYRVYDEAERVVSSTQVVEVHAFALNPDDTVSILKRVFALMQGYRYTNAYAATNIGETPPADALELSGAKTARAEYQIVSLRVAA
jgi:hypothetical protein